MTEFFDRYYPTVALRRGEMRALQKLPRPEKEKILPIVLLAPWLNSIKFENTFKVIEKSVGDLPILVDLDRYYESDSPLESRAYFWSLISPSDGPGRWMELVEQHQNYIPCIQHVNVTLDDVRMQVAWARGLARGYAFRFELERHQNDPLYVAKFLDLLDDKSLLIVDFGWKEFSPKLIEALSEIMTLIFNSSEDHKVVLSGSSFPNDFTDFDDFSQDQDISARLIYSNLIERFGNYNLFYGDWASTKPRTYDGRGSPPLPRVDYPTESRWIIARSKANKWTLEDAALRITRLPEWENRPLVWGTGMIEKTARGLLGRITTAPEATAVRINIHLFVQANYKQAGRVRQPVEEWIDPI